MVQTGDPTNTGKGGVSIWGNKFADEIRAQLKVSLLFIGLMTDSTTSAHSTRPAVSSPWLIQGLILMGANSLLLTPHNRTWIASTPYLEN